MLFLGIDQSLTSTGVALIGNAGAPLELLCIKPKALRGVQRLAYIRDGLRDLLKGKEITQAAREGYSYGSVGTGRVFELGEIGGVLDLMLHDLRIPSIAIPPTSLKLAITGSGAASKDKVRQSVFKRFGWDIDQDDKCDAYSLAQVAMLYTTKKWRTRTEADVVMKLIEANMES